MDSGGAAEGSSEGTTFLLIRRAQGGDEQALDLLYARYLGRIKAWAKGRLPSILRAEMDTDDLVQKTMMKSLRAIGNFEPRPNGFICYLFQIMNNCINDEIDRAKRRPQANASTLDDIRHEGPSPFTALELSEQIRSYERGLGNLGERENDLIRLRIDLCYTFKEVARDLDFPSEDAARMAFNRAMKKLVHEMSGNGSH